MDTLPELAFAADSDPAAARRIRRLAAAGQLRKLYGTRGAGSGAATATERLNQLLKGRIGEFSLDALVNMVMRAGMRVGLTIKPIAGVKVARASAPKRPVARRKNGQDQRVA